MLLKLFHGTQRELKQVYSKQGLLWLINEAQRNYQNKILNPEGNLASRLSRKTDFGFGFYMTDNLEQASMSACKNIDLDSYLYSFNVSEDMFSSCSVFEFPRPDLSWLMFVAYNRNTFNHDDAPDLCDSINETFRDIDLIVGPIADDKCFNVLKRFMKPDPKKEPPKKRIRHKTVRECVQVTPNAKQYLAVSEKICSYLTEQLLHAKNCTIYSKEEQGKINETLNATKKSWELMTNRFLDKEELPGGFNLPEILDIISCRNLTWDDLVNQELTFNDLDEIYDGTQPRQYRRSQYFIAGELQ